MTMQVTPYKLELEIPTEATEDYGTVDLPYEHVDNLIYHCLNKVRIATTYKTGLLSWLVWFKLALGPCSTDRSV